MKVTLVKKSGGSHFFRSSDGHLRVDMHHSSALEDSGLVEGGEYEFSLAPVVPDAPAETSDSETL